MGMLAHENWSPTKISAFTVFRANEIDNVGTCLCQLKTDMLLHEHSIVQCSVEQLLSVKRYYNKNCLCLMIAKSQVA